MVDYYRRGQKTPVMEATEKALYQRRRSVWGLGRGPNDQKKHGSHGGGAKKGKRGDNKKEK